MASTENIINDIKRECNILSSFLNPTKHAKHKNSHYPPILQGYMKTHSGREKFKNFRILLDIRSSSVIVMGKLKSKLKTKESGKIRRKPNPGSSKPQIRQT